jgi:PhnB protein
VLIGNDVPSSVFEKIRSVYIYLSVDSSEEAERIYKLLSQDGQVYTPLGETFYASRFSQLRDRFGVSWSLIHERTQAQ